MFYECFGSITGRCTTRCTLSQAMALCVKLHLRTGEAVTIYECNSGDIRQLYYLPENRATTWAINVLGANDDK